MISTWNFVHIFMRHCPLTYLRFLENFDMGWNCFEKKKLDIFWNFRNFQNFRPSEIAVCSPTNSTSFHISQLIVALNCTSSGDFRKPILLVKIAKHDVTHGWPITTWVLIFWHKVWNCCPERYGKFQSEIPSISGAICEKPQWGPLPPPPPPAGRGLIVLPKARTIAFQTHHTIFRNFPSFGCRS